MRPEDPCDHPHPRGTLPQQLRLWCGCRRASRDREPSPSVVASVAPVPPFEVLESVCGRPALHPDPPAPTDIRRADPREQGEIGVADAIGWFGRRGLTVSVPLIDSQSYDLVVDLHPHGLARVQVKTTTQTSPYGVPVVSLETAGGNRSRHTRTPFDRSASELLYVLGAGRRWVLPSSVVAGTRSLNLGAACAAYEVR